MTTGQRAAAELAGMFGERAYSPPGAHNAHCRRAWLETLTGDAAADGRTHFSRRAEDFVTRTTGRSSVRSDLSGVQREHLRHILCRATRRGDVNMTKQLLEQGAYPDNASDRCAAPVLPFLPCDKRRLR